jgi:hypothetical protein
VTQVAARQRGHPRRHFIAPSTVYMPELRKWIRLNGHFKGEISELEAECSMLKCLFLVHGLSN